MDEGARLHGRCIRCFLGKAAQKRVISKVTNTSSDTSMFKSALGLPTNQTSTATVLAHFIV